MSSGSLGFSVDAPRPSGTTQCCGALPITLPALVPRPPRPPAGPGSLSLRAEEELGLGALRVVQQEEAEEVFVRSVQLHLALFPADGGEGSVVEHQEAAAPARQTASA